MPATASTARSKSESTKSGRFTRTAHFLFTQILPPAATAAAMEGAAACVEAAAPAKAAAGASAAHAAKGTTAEAAAHSAAVDVAGHGDLLRAVAYRKCVCSVRSNIRSAYYYCLERYSGCKLCNYVAA